MEKVDLTKQFAYRLKDAMISAGYNSVRSSSGVDINKLSEITGYSSQICRKYLRGEAIPEPAKLMDIAMKLHVSPGWLLFGDQCNYGHLFDDNISISKNLLHYIFIRANCLYNSGLSVLEIANFLLEVASDISELHADETQSKKIIDLTLNSIKHLIHHGSN